MAATGLLYEIFPELIDSVGCSQNDWHHLDVMEHVLCAYGHLEEILAATGDYFPENADALEQYLKEGESPLPALKYALLLHDVAKPETKTTGDDGRMHFYRHAERGAERALAINNRLKLSKKASAFSGQIVRHHLRIVPFLTLLDEDKVTKRSILRYFLRTGGDTGLYVILHNLADLMASRGIKRATGDEVQKVAALSDTMLGVYFGEFLVQIKNPPLITGRHLIDELGLTPSPAFKDILGRVYDKQIAGEISTEEEAEEFVKSIYKNYRK